MEKKKRKAQQKRKKFIEVKVWLVQKTEKRCREKEYRKKVEDIVKTYNTQKNICTLERCPLIILIA